MAPYSHHSFLWADWITRILLQIEDERFSLSESLSAPHITTIYNAHHQPCKIEENTDSVTNKSIQVLLWYTLKVRSWSSKHWEWQGSVNGKPPALHVTLSSAAIVSLTNRRSRSFATPAARIIKNKMLASSLGTLRSIGSVKARQKLYWAFSHDVTKTIDPPEILLSWCIRASKN